MWVSTIKGVIHDVAVVVLCLVPDEPGQLLDAGHVPDPVRRHHAAMNASDACSRAGAGRDEHRRYKRRSENQTYGDDTMATRMAVGATPVDEAGATSHSDPAHGVLPGWWRIGMGGQYWEIDGELVAYIPRGNASWLFIFSGGQLVTHFQCSRRYLEDRVLIPRLERLGWRALFRAPRVGRDRVLAYFGLASQPARCMVREAV